MVGQWRTLVGWRSRHVVQSRPRGAVVFRYLATRELQAFFEHICSFIHPPIHLQVRSFIYSIHKSKVIEIFVYSRCLIVENIYCTPTLMANKMFALITLYWGRRTIN